VAGRLSEPTHVVGHSFGGEVAIDLALAAPHLVTGLTLVCSRDTPFPPFAAAAAELRAGAPIDVERAMSRWFRPGELAAGGPLVDYARRQLRHADRPGYARALDAIATYDRSAVVSSIEVPVTLVAAELDAVSTPAAMADLASRLPRVRLHVLPGAAHLSPFLDAPALATLIRSVAGRDLGQ
jgi:pimeloyl-ACP methyl ester carboxylesterase